MIRPPSQGEEQGIAEGTISPDAPFLSRVKGKDSFSSLTLSGPLMDSLQPSEAPAFTLPPMSCTFTRPWCHGVTIPSQISYLAHLSSPRMCSTHIQVSYFPSFLLNYRHLLKKWEHHLVQLLLKHKGLEL